MQQYTSEQLTAMLTSRKVDPIPVVIYRESFVMNAKMDEEVSVLEAIPTPYFARVMTIPERAKVQAALDAARNQGKSEYSCLSLVVRLGACSGDGTRLLPDNWEGTGQADESILAIFDTTMIANGWRKPRTMLVRDEKGQVKTETTQGKTPVDVIGGN